MTTGAGCIRILCKRNRPAIPHAAYENPLVRAAVEQRAAFLNSKVDRLYTIEIFWVVMIDGSYRKAGLLDALSRLPGEPRRALRELRALFSGNKRRTLLYKQIERDRLRLRQKVESLRGQMSDLTEIEPLGAEPAFQLLRSLVNTSAAKIDAAPLPGASHLDAQVCGSELEAHRGYLRLDEDCLRVLTLKERPRRRGPCSCRACLISRPTFTPSSSGIP